MSKLAELRQARDARDQARALLDGRVERLRGDIEARGIGGRIADEATEKAADALEQAAAIAEENKAVVAGTIVALAVWFLRNPLVALASKALGQGDELEKETDND